MNAADMPQRYVVEELGNDLANVIHLGPYVVSKDIRVHEAIALAAALNEEIGER
jgi:hypothetical protein